MTRSVLSPRARAEIAEIWDYTEAQWSAEQAEIYLRQIEMAIEAVALQPMIGQSCDDVRTEYRRHPAGSQVVFYRLRGDYVDIIRLLHARMDLRRHL